MQGFMGYDKYFVLRCQSSKNPLRSSSNWVNCSDLCFENINLAIVWRMNWKGLRIDPRRPIRRPLRNVGFMGRNRIIFIFERF